MDPNSHSLRMVDGLNVVNKIWINMFSIPQLTKITN